MSKELEFICPKCGDNRLECVEINATVSSVITNLDDEGDFNYESPSIEDSEVDRFQCLICGYILKNKEFNVNINENKEVVEWIKENCS